MQIMRAKQQNLLKPLRHQCVLQLCYPLRRGGVLNTNTAIESDQWVIPADRRAVVQGGMTPQM